MGSDNDTKPGLDTVSNVEIFSTGRHQRVVWTHAKLDKAVANFIEHQLPGRVDKAPPVVLGHSEDQAFMRDSGYPKVGKPIEMRRQDVKCRLCHGSRKAPVGVEAYDEDGSCPICLGTGVQGLIIAKLGEVPRSIAKLINARAYDNVSAEMVEEQPPQVPMQGPSLRRLALVGGKLPHIKTLADLPQADYEGFDEIEPDLVVGGLICSQRIDGMRDGAWECFHETFAEVKPMEEFAEGKTGMDWAKKLINYGHKPETVEKMDEQAGMEMADMHDKLSMPKYEHGDKSDEDWAKHEPRQEAVEKYGEMCAEKKKHYADRGKRLFGEEHFAEAEAMAEFSSEQLAQITQAVVSRIRADVDPLKKDVADFKLQTKAATKRARVEAFCERMKASMKVAAHEFDATAVQANPRFRTLPQRLMAMDDIAVVEKFSEGGKEVALTQLDLEMAAIEARPSLRYGEQVRGSARAGGGDPELLKVEQFCELNATRLKKIGTSPADVIEAFKLKQKQDPDVKAESFITASA